MTKLDIWLDRIPKELCCRIASYVSGGQITDNALQLARVSTSQCNAVLLSLSCDFTNISDEWVQVFMSSKLSFTSYNGGFQFTKKNRPHYFYMFKSQQMRRVSISEDVNFLFAMGHMPSVRELDIEVTEQIPRDIVFELFSTLKLKKLTLRCRAWWEHDSECLFNDRRYFNASYNALQRSCPGLESMHVDCLCQEENPPFWGVFLGLQSLREVKCRLPTAAAMHKLRTLDSVQLFDLIDGQSAYGDAIAVGAAVTDLRSLRRLDEEAIAGLGACSRLSVLRCTIAEGCERALLDVCGRLTRLKTLQINWHTPWEIDMDDELPCYDLVEGVLPLLPKQLRGLREMRLCHIQVPLAEVVEMQRGFGKRLEVFEVHVRSEKEEPLECLERVLQTASECNASLRCLCLFGVGLGESYEGCDSVYGKQARRALAALHRLEKSAQCFLWMPLEKTLEHIVEICS